MERRIFLTLLAAASASVVASCGSDNPALPAVSSPSDTADPSVPDTAATPSSDPATESPAESTGEPILTLTSEGGFTTREYAFQNPAMITVTDDGRVITLSEGPVTDSVLPMHQERTISAEGIAALRSMLDDAGLFADVEYPRNDFIADASTATLVVVAADGTEYRHEAYALALGGGLPGDPASLEDDPARATLASVIDSLRSELDSVVGAETLGPVGPWTPDAVQISVVPLGAMEPAPEADIVAWPATTGVDLDTVASDSRCVEIERASIGAFFDELTRPVVFEQDEVLYEVYVRPAYPGRSCDA